MRPQELTLLGELDLCAADSKSEPDVRLNGEFLREFAKEKPDVIQWAFRTHRRESQFFPSINEITVLIGLRRRELWEASEAERRQQEKSELDQARAEGKLVDISDLRQMIADTVKRMPETPADIKHNRLQEAEVRIETPPLPLTAEQIAARREQERAEIKRYQREA